MRSILCVPANQAKMVNKALELDCDQIILDLEDSVIPAEKAVAREYLASLLPTLKSEKRISIRINEFDSPFAQEDIALLKNTNTKQAFTVTLPKIHSAQVLHNWVSTLPAGIQLEAQIESAEGLINAAEIAAHPQVISLAFGPADFMASLGMPSVQPGTPREEAAYSLQWPLFQIVIAAHAHNKLAYDGPYFHIGNSEGLELSARVARALGADGKWAIHPSQIDACNRAFTPDAEEIESAQAIIEAFNKSSGAVKLGGLMIDEASKKVAERLLERATQIRK